MALHGQEYKIHHEEFIANNTGTNLIELYLVFTPLPLSLILAVFTTPLQNSWYSFCVQTAILLLPITLSSTVLADSVLLLVTIMVTACVCLWIYVSRIPQTTTNVVTDITDCLTNYRATINLATALCILAVDFPIFPRRFAKTENFGYGMMDLGVGSFIFSNGLVYKHRSLSVPKIFKEIIPLLLLGFLRVVSVKSLEYQEHMSEYGVHWNFFFTLAFTKLTIYFVLYVTSHRPLFLGILLAILHQSLLTFVFQTWVFANTSREGFLLANKEGLSSLLGYVSLYFLAISVGDIIHQKCAKITLFFKVSTLTIALWALTVYFESMIGVSRRLANLGYILWVLSYNSTIITHYLMCDILLDMKHVQNKSTFLLQSINYNGLFFFLISNLLTGCVNIVFQTIYMSPVSSLVILLCYMAALSVVMQILYYKKIKMRF